MSIFQAIYSLYEVASRKFVLPVQVRRSILYEDRLYSYSLKGTNENRIGTMGILVLIVVGVLFLAIIGLGWNTFFEGVVVLFQISVV